MLFISDNKLSNGDNTTDDNYYKINSDTKLLMARLEIVKKKLSDTPWRRLWTYLKLRKELYYIGRETDEIGKRLKKLDDDNRRNPIQIIKRV